MSHDSIYASLIYGILSYSCLYCFGLRKPKFVIIHSFCHYTFGFFLMYLLKGG